MFEIASQMTMCLLIAGLFGFIIGYLSSNKECVEHHTNDDNHKVEEAKAEQEAKAKAKAEQEAKEKEEAEAKAKAEQEAKEKEEAEAKEETKDDLTKIKGLGPKTETTLNSLGITTFKQIASWTKDDVDMVNKKIAIHGKSNRASWIKQAKSFMEES